MNTDPDIIAEAREFVLDSMDNASPDLTRIVLSQINKASREATVKNFNTGGQAQGPQFDNNPNESATVTDLTSGIEYDTSTGLPVVEISQYEAEDDRQEREARQAANFNLNALNNTAFAQLAGKAILGKSFNPIEEITGLNVPNIPTSPFGLAVWGLSKIDENQTRNVLSQKSKDDQIDILSQIVSLENRQDAEFSTRAVNTPMDTSLQDYERAEQQVGIPSAPAVPAAPAPSAPSPEQAAADIALNTDVGERAGIDVGMSAPDVDVSAPDVSAPDAPDAPDSHGGIFNKGGPVNMQVGGEVDNADTNMEVANMPMGVVGDMDGAPAPFNGGTGVEDDLDMEVEAGSYILNAEAVQLIGVSDINKVIRDAYSIAAALGKPMPEDYDPQDKVPIRISNGEAVIPRALVDIVGLDKLEKWNTKGLELRKQKEEAEAEQQQAQAQQPQVASEAPMQQQMGQLMDKGGKVEASLISRIVSSVFGDDPIGDVKKTVEKQEAFTNIIKQVIDESKFTSQEIEEELEEFEKAEGGIIPSFKDGGFIDKLLDKSEKLIEAYITGDKKFPRKAVLKMTSLATHIPYKLGIGDRESWKENPVIQEIINNDPIIEKIIQAESSGRPRIMSPAGAVGLMQIMPDTWKDPGLLMTGKDNLAGLLDPEENVRFGAEYFRRLKQRFGNTEHALIAYNWGMGNTEEWIERGQDKSKLPKETQKYINKILPVPPKPRPRPNRN